MKNSMKDEFGARFREARDSKKLSRAALAMRLGISPKTIQSWEMGRTFIEDLSLVPAIENELETSFAYLLGQTDISQASAVAEEAVAYGTRQSTDKPADRAHAGPLSPVVEAVELPGASVESMEEGYIAAPLLKPSSAAKEVAELQNKDIQQYCLFPVEWCTRGRVLVAYRMADSALVPMIPQGSHVLVDRRINDAERLEGNAAAVWLADRGLRIRKIAVDPDTGDIEGLPFKAGGRGQVSIDPEKGDLLLGRVLGVMAPL